MSQTDPDRLFKLLPAVYRLRDAGQGRPLQALLAVLEGERQLLEDDIHSLYGNWFIETCEEWVVPYLGDLLGVRNLNALENSAFSQRAYVANTLGYRRRKGTATMLEQLARDLTGWPAKAVEFFELLGTTQYLNHVRPDKGGTVEVRDADRLERLDGPFDRIAHTADVRHIDNGRGRHNIPHIGLFLWRLQQYPIERGTAYALADPSDGRYAFHPLGLDAPLFNPPVTETGISQVTAEINVPGRLSPRTLWRELDARRKALKAGAAYSTRYFGELPVLALYFDDVEVEPEEIVICDLSDWVIPLSRTITLPDSSTFQTRAAVDPKLGRLAVLDAAPPAAVEVSCSHGFSADVGGGPYDRRSRADDEDGTAGEDTIADPEALGTRYGVPSDHATIAGALTAWSTAGCPPAVIELEDSSTHALGAAPLSIDMSGPQLVIQAANKERPVLIGDLLVTGVNPKAKLTLNGLLTGGNLHIKGKAALGELNLVDCTFAPGTALAEDSLTVDPPNDHLQILLDRCIAGPLRVPEETAGLTIRDSILRAPSLRAGALISGNLKPFPALTSAAGKLRVAVGDEGPYTVALPSGAPANLESARERLETAIRSASGNPAFAGARVYAANRRLIVFAGCGDPITFTDAVDGASVDPTASELKLTAPAARPADALFSGKLEPFPILNAAAPELRITVGAGSPFDAALSPIPTTLAKAATALQAAVRSGGTTAAFADAIVVRAGDRLAVLPGEAGVEIVFETSDDDATTLDELALEGQSAAIASADGGEVAGPPTTIERTTVFGPVRVKEMTLASETIFHDRIRAERHQEGCVRFSYVTEGSRTPRRFRCQPDLALADRAKELGLESAGDLPAAERARVLARTYPLFTATRYGDPAFAQLDSRCAEEIREGSEDESEMGAFQTLQQPQREANLRASLREYLRFGLEAGLIFAT